MTTTNDTLLGDLRVNDPDDLDWVRVHPEVLQYAPAWATDLEAEFEPDGGVIVTFDGNFGSVQIATLVTWRAGEVTPTNDADVFFRENEGVIDAETLNAYARDFAAAASAFADASKAGA